MIRIVNGIINTAVKAIVARGGGGREAEEERRRGEELEESDVPLRFRKSHRALAHGFTYRQAWPLLSAA